MSALTLLSVPAPAVSSASQGSPAEAASGFQALLAVETGKVSAAPESTAGPVADPDKEDGASTAPDSPGLLTAPVVMPSPPPMSGPAADTEPAGETDGTVAGGETGAGNEPADGSDDPEDMTPLLTDKTPSSRTGGPQVQPPIADVGATPSAKTTGPQVQPAIDDVRAKPSARTTDPQVQPPIADVRSPGTSTGGTALTLAEAAGATEADRVGVRTGAVPASAAPPMPGPAPLRPLAERTSRPLEAPAAESGDTPRAGDAAPTRTPALAATPTVAPPAAGPRDAIAVAAASASSSEGAPAEFASSGEGAAAPSDTPAVSREAALSQLSRVTIEATAQIAAQILRRLEGRSTRFEMALTPDELGRVDVKLDIDAEGRLNARLAFDNPAAATDLRGRADELRRQLEEAGFHLAEDAFEFAERDSGSSAFDRGQDGRNGQSRAFNAAARLNAESDVAQPPRWLALSLSPSGVDLTV